MGRKKNSTTSPDKDICYTPEYAADPILPYLSGELWEAAAGGGMLAAALRDRGHQVIESDLATGQDFFTYEPDRWDMLITNPPFSLKYRFMERCYAFGKPFALLMPIDVFGSKAAQGLFDRYSVEIVLLNERIDFYMPNKGWDGDGANFSVAWFTYGLKIGATLHYADITQAKKRFKARLEQERREIAGQLRLQAPMLL